MGGEELNDSPTQRPRRSVIDFGERSEDEARKWPLLFDIVERKVKPNRLKNEQKNRRENWWMHVTRVPDATRYLNQHGRILALSQVSAHLSVSFVGKGVVYANTLVLALLHTNAAFASMQSTVHDLWARLVGSSMKDDLRYTASDCLDTFPFPPGVVAAARGEAAAAMNAKHQELDVAGQRYYEFRAKLMVEHNEGLTATYNRFHDPEERDESILRLRELHAEMDRAVLDAYGWTDIEPRCEFLLDYEEATDEEESGKRRKKKPWRYRWHDEARDEVLARLIALNGERVTEERRVGASVANTAGAAEKPKRMKKSMGEGSGGLFG
jgi:hypothetical protein